MARYFSLDELSEYIKLSKSTIYKKTSLNLIPFIKSGKKLLFKQEAIDEWLDSCSQLTIMEINNSATTLLKRNNNDK